MSQVTFSYAVLGAIDNTGQSLLQLLLPFPDKQTHAYCRSNDNVRIREGSLDNASLVADCISSTKAVFPAVASSDNVPGCTVAQDAARVVASAMEKLREDVPNATAPRLVVLGSASLNERFCGDISHLARRVLFVSASNVYVALVEAEKFLRSREDWISTTFMKPGGARARRAEGA